MTPDEARELAYWKSEESDALRDAAALWGQGATRDVIATLMKRADHARAEKVRCLLRPSAAPLA